MLSKNESGKADVFASQESRGVIKLILVRRQHHQENRRSKIIESFTCHLSF